MAKKLTPKKAKTLEILVENTGKSVSAAMREAGYSPATAKNPSVITESEAYKALFPPERTQQVVDNLHKLAINAEEEKTQIEATKVYLDKALPKDTGNISINFNQVAQKDRDEFGI